MTLEDTFLEAVKAGETDKVADMLIQHPELANARNAQGESAVLQAKYRGRDNILHMLLGLDPTSTVYEAAVVGNIEVVRRAIAAEPGIVSGWLPMDSTCWGWRHSFPTRKSWICCWKTARM